MANVNITDFDSQRQHTYGNSTSGYPLTSPYGQPASHAQALRAAQYLSTGNPMMQQSHPNSGMAALAQSFGGMSLQSPYSPAGRPGSQMPAPTDYHSGVALSQAPAMYISNQQQLLYPGGHLMSGTNTAQAAAGLYTPMPSIVQSCGYPGYGQRTEASPNSQLWTPRIASDGSQGMPTLITPRRDSVSSNEEHLPGTPYTGVNTFGSYGNSVAVLDRSPSGHFTQAGTPSPSQFLPGYQMQQIGKSPAASSTPLAIQLLVQREPAIPRAIPAPSSPVKPLDRCLENKNGETNVYIRGLLPETTDEMLRNWGERFGDIVSSKAIIEHKNGLCKGFGFVKYHNFDDAENCIRGFHYLGYETSFARESFYSKLKKFADENNTNLYISNIPKNINEFELQAYFQPFKVCSSKILRDDSSNGRGVGFCRFESRDICEEIIKKFNNTAVRREGGEEHVIQIRYADTQEQKMLKQQTAAARQFRAAEFEYGCLQAGRGALLHGVERLHSASPAATDHTGTTNDFEQYMQGGNGVYVSRPLSARTTFLAGRPSLPSIKSDQDTTTPQVPVTSKGEGGVALEVDDGKNRPATPSVTQGETSTAAGATAE